MLEIKSKNFAGNWEPVVVSLWYVTKMMMGIALNNVRIGKRYRLINHREVFEFEIMEACREDEFRLKDIHTLEEYFMSDLVKFGKGKDFAIVEL